MSLNYDLSAISERLGDKAFDELISDPQNNENMHPVTNALIWATMTVSLNGITEATVDEFWFRLSLLQALDGPMLKGAKHKIYITRQDVEDHIGLRTNVTSRRRNAWLSAQLQRQSGDDIYWVKDTPQATSARKRIELILQD